MILKIKYLVIQNLFIIVYEMEILYVLNSFVLKLILSNFH